MMTLSSGSLQVSFATAFVDYQREMAYGPRRRWTIFPQHSSPCLRFHANHRPMPEEEAFAVLVQLMNEYRLREFYKPCMTELGVCMHQLDGLIAEHLPELHTHFTTQAFAPSHYASAWFLTLFATAFPLPMTTRVMDLFIAEAVQEFILAETKRISSVFLSTVNMTPYVELSFISTKQIAQNWFLQTVNISNADRESCQSEMTATTSLPVAMGMEFILRLSLAILKQFAPRLLTMDMETMIFVSC
ncbi:unnamed protein product [Mesocestoides corti]|uniref:Rab-GAP TBC domain-containing protein n=1 Tax=Mesocestoides corti TaxID=53468 RepID=A0A0R3UCU1_MESCO|nr:unnamed protein product [Mesocestoides corti]